MCILNELSKKTEEKFGVSTREVKRITAAVKYFDLELFEDVSNPVITSVSGIVAES